ncbi:hypothetical protein BDW59DRAFT_138555 [Aspergillus cavernicola]|uniref:AMP-binding enzyme C-terminal domain-containing protein n=1 Tax=Aspergillus cavernicola TaxID=176166 RepID=A0ABR4J011_9EURO
MGPILTEGYLQGFQVALAELEACILSHPATSDCAVILVVDARAGEVPKAIVVKSSNLGPGGRVTLLKRDMSICREELDST